MHALMFAALMSLPLYPLNPTGQDTINYMNLHLTAGYNGPSSAVSAGPEVTLKYELTLFHPFIFRTALEYRYGQTNALVYPEGDIHRTLLAAEVIYYRGTKKFTGYLGGGPVFALHSFSPTQSVLDSLFAYNHTTDLEVNNVFGYRITAGLRIHRIYSIEVGITEIRPSFVYTAQYDPASFSTHREKFRFNDFRVTLGYLFTLKI